MAEEKTNISSVSDKELADLLTMGDAQNVITESIEDNSNIFKRDSENSDLVMGVKKETPIKSDKIEKVEDDEPEEIEKEITLAGEVEEESEEDKNKEKSKNRTFIALEKLVKSGNILLFEGDKSLEDYTEKEQGELIQANLDRVREEAEESAPAEFFDSIPDSLKFVAKYHADGGKDLKSIYKYLAENEEIKELDITTEEGQEKTVRSYFKMNGDMSPEEIEEELNSLKDLPGALEKKAKLYKPKLDAKQQQIIDKEINDQEIRRNQHQQAVIKYRETVINTLSAGELNGLKITPSVQNMLFEGLTNSNYPSVSGRNTNLLGHLLEQNNYVKPNPVLISKVLWLLKDEKAYEDAIKASANKEMVIDTVKKLKGASDTKITNSLPSQNIIQNKTVTKTLANPKKNIFSR